MTDIPWCPACNGPVTRDEVDIGVGTLYGPARCDSCGWSEPEPDTGLLPIDEEPDPDRLRDDAIERARLYRENPDDER